MPGFDLGLVSLITITMFNKFIFLIFFISIIFIYFFFTFMASIAARSIHLDEKKNSIQSNYLSNYNLVQFQEQK